MSRTFDSARGRWIPWVFVGMMALVITVNGGMIYAALSTFTGTTTGHAYDRGRAYNQVIAEAERQAALGWTSQVTLASGRLAVVVLDRDGKPVSGELEGLLQRPLDRRTLPLSFGGTAPGAWIAGAASLAPGQWEARLTLVDAAGSRLEFRQRVIAP